MTPDSVTRGRLHLYLAIAPGAGKTCALLDEAHRRSRGGRDVVAALVESHGRAAVEERLAGLETMPARTVAYRGTSFEELDVEAVLRRHPQSVLVDELAHTNTPGSRHDKRWQDVADLLDAGIDVVSALNVQHISSLADSAAQITGVDVHETVPDTFLTTADHIDFLDIDATELRRRLPQLYDTRTAGRALHNYYRPEHLKQLRTLAQQWLGQHLPQAPTPPAQNARRIVVALTGEPEGDHTLCRAALLAAATTGELIGVHVRDPSGLADPVPAWLEPQRRLLTELGGRYTQLAGADVAGAILDFARTENATDLVLGATRRTSAFQALHGSVINRAIRSAGSVEVHVIPPRKPPKHRLDIRLGEPVEHRRAQLSPRRRSTSWLLALLAPPALAAALSPAHSSLGLAGALFCVLLPVLLTALVGGIRPALLATATGVLAADYFFTAPYHSLRVDRLLDLVALIAFACVAATIGLLVDILAGRGLQAARAQAEAENLAQLTADTLAAGPHRPSELAETVRRTFDLDAVAVMRPSDTGWQSLASAGHPVPATPDEAPYCADLADGTVLALAGSRLTEPDARLLRAFVTELRQENERVRLHHMGHRMRSTASDTR